MASNRAEILTQVASSLPARMIVVGDKYLLSVPNTILASSVLKWSAHVNSTHATGQSTQGSDVEACPEIVSAVNLNVSVAAPSPILGSVHASPHCSCLCLGIADCAALTCTVLVDAAVTAQSLQMQLCETSSVLDLNCH